MTAEKGGIRSILSFAWAYNFFQRAAAKQDGRQVFVDKIGALQPETKVLDVGCGTGEILAYLPVVDYLGIDPSGRYIDEARERFGDRGEFRVADTAALEDDQLGSFDVVIASGVLHHISDDEVSSLAASAKELLTPDGSFVTIDPCFHIGQGSAARTIVGLDRGQHVRNDTAYADLLAEHFPTVDAEIRTDVMRFPYAHVLIRCTS